MTVFIPVTMSWGTFKKIVHCYNQRAEDSENRIKELKLDFGGDTLPYPDFHANALYFLISALSYNVFALMRQLLPEELAQHRVMTLRWRLYAMAAVICKAQGKKTNAVSLYGTGQCRISGWVLEVCQRGIEERILVPPPWWAHGDGQP